MDFAGLLGICRANHIQLVVVGPEQPLVEGISDYFEAHAPDIAVIGPNREAAQLEGSKAYSKEFMQRFGIPTATFQSFSQAQLEEANTYIRSHTLPVVVKADGLAAGKGVIIAQTHTEAEEAVFSMLKANSFGESGHQVVIEQYLSGTELSVFILTDGLGYVLLPEAKDYKRIGDGDTGLNTGGMGAVSPVPFFEGAFKQKVIERIVEPTLASLRSEGILYKGFIFFGLINCDDEPFVIEYNCRLGDPETEAVLPRMEGDFLTLLEHCASGTLQTLGAYPTEDATSLTVVLAAAGYPSAPERDKPILVQTEPTEHLRLYHAGTKQEASGEIRSAGGRVMAVTAKGKNLLEAREEAYKAIEKIRFDGMQYRKDIGLDLMHLYQQKL
jgi:phosphoribosylamine--glycine ligase